MKKYVLIARYTWDEAFTYRFNFVMWRIKIVLQLLTAYFLWSTIFTSQTTIASYSKGTMIAYILGTNILSSVVLSTRTGEVGNDIIQGTLANYLLRPMNYFLYWFSKDMGDKAINIAFSLIEVAILIFLLRPPFLIQTNPQFIGFGIIACGIAVILYFFINVILGMIGFWSNDVWGPRFLFFIFLTFFAGGLFPLDILPTPLFAVFSLLPFPYLLFFPLKVLIGQLSFVAIFQGIAVGCVWIGILFVVTVALWRLGLKQYGAYGR